MTGRPPTDEQFMCNIRPGERANVTDLELVVSVTDCSTVYANGAALAYAQARNWAVVCVAAMCADEVGDDRKAFLSWIRAGIDGAMTIPTGLPSGAILPMTVTLQSLRSGPKDDVDLVLLRFSSADSVTTPVDALAEPGHLDSLTGLLERPGLLDALNAALLERSDTAVLFVDMDHFKRVNDTRGHHAGDQLLSEFAARLRSAVPHGTIARFGGDEFVIVLPSTDADALDICVHNILDGTSRPFRLGSAEVTMSASIGIARVGPDECDRDVDRLLREADLALFEAKRLGRGRAQVFTDRLREQFVERVELEDALRTALDRHEVSLEYQPQISLQTGRVVSVEALARWKRDGVNIPPDRFIRIAEDTGMIDELGRYVLDAACRQHALWRQNLEHPPATIAVNVSPLQLNDPRFFDHVVDTLARHHVPPSALCIEITETGFEGLLEELDALHRLRELGCYIGMDDFGTGYSSLARLRDLPVDILKIDHRFVAGLGIDSDDTAIVSAIMSLSLTLGLHVIAEGVELPEQAAALTRLGCPVAQGYLFARPEPAPALTSRMMSSRIWKPVGGGNGVGDATSPLVTSPRIAHRTFIREFLDHIGVPMQFDDNRGWDHSGGRRRAGNST